MDQAWGWRVLAGDRSAQIDQCHLTGHFDDLKQLNYKYTFIIDFSHCL